MANKTLTLSPASQAYLVEHSVREPEILQRLRAETAGDGMSMIDADKTNYSGYYERVLTLLRSGSLIAVDNTLWGVRVINNKAQSTDTRAIRPFNDRLRADLRVPLSLPLVGDGLSFTLTLICIDPSIVGIPFSIFRQYAQSRTGGVTTVDQSDMRGLGTA